MKQKILLIDTETVGLKPNNIAYDIGWAVIDKTGHIYEKHSYLVREIITDGKKMRRAFFSDRVFSHYIPKLDAGEISLLDGADIFNKLSDSANSCAVLSGYNLGFDIGAMRQTKNILQHDGSVFKRRPNLLCIWLFACTVLFRSRNYHNIARANGWVSDAGNFRTTAEHAYRYITGNLDFEESHTALEDVIIESEILATLYGRKKKIPYNDLNTIPWRIAQEGK